MRPTRVLSAIFDGLRDQLRPGGATCRCLVTVILCLLGAGPAFAGEPQPIATRREPMRGFSAARFELPDVSAWCLRGGELEVGPFAVRYGLFDLFQIGTRFALNLFGALNAEVKWTIHDGDKIGVAVDAGLLRFDPALVGVDDGFTVWAFPVALRASGRPSESVRVHGAIEFLSSDSGGEASDPVKRVQRYLGPVGRLAAEVGVEWRQSEHLGFLALIETPLILHRDVFRYAGEEGAFDFISGKLALELVYESLNVRVGGGYGPSFLGKSALFPVFDLTFRIY